MADVRWRMETRGVRDVIVLARRAATLAGFLLARIAEDEITTLSGDCKCGEGPRRPDCGDRILAECEAKRRIVEAAERVLNDAAYDDLAEISDADIALATDVERLLAQPYADHPDFRPEWRL